MLLVTALVAVGLVLILNARATPFTGEEASISEIFEKLNFYYVGLQLGWFILGCAAIFVICLIDYHVYADLIKIPYVILCILLIALLVIGNTKKGTAGWYDIGSRGFQPSEFMKIILTIGMAKYASEEVDKNGRLGLGPSFFKMSFFMAIPFVLVAAQPDLGTALTYIVIWLAILFVSKFPWRGFLGIGILGILSSIAYFLFGMKTYQKARIINRFPSLAENNIFKQLIVSGAEQADVTSNYDSLQMQGALKAIRNGGFWGQGFFKPGNNVHLAVLPEAHTDFIFASGIEVIGFVGGLVIIILYALLLARALYLAIQAKDNLGRFIIIGIVAMEVYHVFENIGMNIGLMPITGIPLPFISYGGSNMITNMIAIGMVLNVGMRRQGKKQTD